MSYYTSKMTGEAKKRKYEREREYRSARKSVCMVIPKSAYAYINKFAKRLGWSFTKTLMYGSVWFWFTKTGYELDFLKDFGGDYEFYCEGVQDYEYDQDYVHDQD